VPAFITLALLLVASFAAAGPGEKLYNEFVEKGQLYGDEAWQEYVNELGHRLLAHSRDMGKEYNFFMLDNSGINAFATPDAYIFVNRGLVAFLSSEDELAAVVGHEIGHVVARHARRQKTVNLFGKSVGLLAAIYTGRGELLGVSNAATGAVVSGYGREMELEADRYGAEFLAKAGYNPLSIIDVVQVLKDQELFAKQVANKQPSYHGLFATHPKNDKRLHDAVAYAQSLLPDEVVAPIADFWEMIDGIVYGDGSTSGLVKDTTFYHSGLRMVIEFPKGWSLINSQSSVTGTAPGGDDEAFIILARHEREQDLSPEEFLVDRLQRDDITSGEKVEINGNETFVGEVVNENSDVKLKLIGVLYRGKDAFLFTGQAGPDGDSQAFRTKFIETIQSLRGMTAADAQIANKQRIRVIVAEPDITYAGLAKETSIQHFPEETLRLLNAGHPFGEPRAGNYIKIVK